MSLVTWVSKLRAPFLRCKKNGRKELNLSLTLELKVK